jgi:ribosomal protein L29
MAKKQAPKEAEVVAAKVAKAPKNVDYKSMKQSELQDAIKTLQDDVLALKRGTVTREVQNVRAYGYRRKELARALTALNSNISKEEQ